MSDSTPTKRSWWGALKISRLEVRDDTKESKVHLHCREDERGYGSAECSRSCEQGMDFLIFSLIFLVQVDD